MRVLDLRLPEYALAARQFVKGSILDAAAVRDSLDGVDEVYHLAGLPGMWMPDKNDFYAVNCHGTDIVLAAARERGVSRFLHCSTESILFSPANGDAVVTESVRTRPEEMPGAYTRSKLLAEERAQQAAASGFPVVIANPTMPIGQHRGLTPPTAMLHYFLKRRIQVYIDFVLNLVDVRDVAALKGAVAMGVEELGGIDIVVANAGISTLGKQHEDPAAGFRDKIQAWIGRTFSTVFNRTSTPYAGAA